MAFGENCSRSGVCNSSPDSQPATSTKCRNELIRVGKLSSFCRIHTDPTITNFVMCIMLILCLTLSTEQFCMEMKNSEIKIQIHFYKVSFSFCLCPDLNVNFIQYFRRLSCFSNRIARSKDVPSTWLLLFQNHNLFWKLNDSIGFRCCLEIILERTETSQVSSKHEI